MRGRIREEDADLAKPGHGDHPSPGDVGTSIWSLVQVEAEGTWQLQLHVCLALDWALPCLCLSICTMGRAELQNI